MAELIKGRPEVVLEVLMTHFASADLGDQASIDLQLDQLDAAELVLKRAGVAPTLRHAANSAAILASPRARLNLVRPGIALFGVASTPVRATSAEQALEKERAGEALFRRAGELARESLEEPLSDIHASSEFRRHLAGVMVERALAQAFERAGDSR